MNTIDAREVYIHDHHSGPQVRQLFHGIFRIAMYR